MQTKKKLKLYLNKNSLEYLLKFLKDIQFKILFLSKINYLFLKLYCSSIDAK